MSGVSEIVQVVAEMQAKNRSEVRVRANFNRTADASLKAQGCLS